MGEEIVYEHECASGFLIEIRPLPPYYVDFILDALPLPDFPRRRFVNVAGDEFYFEYKLPDDPPDPEDEEEYVLYMEWHYVRAAREEISKQRMRARRDFLLVNCVAVVDGPFTVDDDDWVQELEAALRQHGYKIPVHPGERMLAFLKSKVIVTEDDWEMVKQHSTFIEVTVEDIIAAMNSMNMQWDDRPLMEVIEGKEKSLLSYNAVVLEAETAEAYGIPLDGQWYSIPVLARSYMVAAHVGRNMAQGLIEEQAVEKAKRHAR